MTEDATQGRPLTDEATAATPVPRTYLHLTRTATYSFLAALPLLLLYEALILLANRGETMQVRVGAEVWIKRVLLTLGGTGMLAVGLVVLAVGLAIFFAERKRAIPLRPRYFGWMVAESIGYAVVVAFFVSYIVGAIFMMTPVPQSQGLLSMLALSIGAGLYEELVFRVVLVGGLYVGLRKVLPRRITAYLVAAVVGALVFSAVHYIGALGDAFTLPSFLFRFLFGLALNALFLVRGFGIAAWTHALYDIMVVTHLLG